MQRQIRSELTERAEIASVEVFAANLRKLLLTPPVRGKTILAVDPGLYREWSLKFHVTLATFFMVYNYKCFITTRYSFFCSEKLVIPIIQLPEYLMSTVLFTRRIYQTQTYKEKTIPIPTYLNYRATITSTFTGNIHPAVHSPVIPLFGATVITPVSLVVLSLVFRL